jgi:hypothetical protein
MKIYIAGPMRGIKNFNFPAFFEAEERIRAACHSPVNPARRDVEQDGFNPASSEPRPFIEYMRLDLPMVMDCDAVAVLPGWRKSKGASLEVHVAVECGLDILDARTLEPLKETVLEEAQRLIHGDRQQDYGHPSIDFQRIAGMWRSLFGWECKPHHVGMAMAAVKLSRMVESPGKRDHYADLAGYAGCAWMCAEKEREANAL